MRPTSCALGIDLGTSTIKLVAVSRDGHVVESARESYDPISTAAGQDTGPSYYCAIAADLEDDLHVVFVGSGTGYSARALTEGIARASRRRSAA